MVHFQPQILTYWYFFVDLYHSLFCPEIQLMEVQDIQNRVISHIEGLDIWIIPRFSVLPFAVIVQLVSQKAKDPLPVRSRDRCCILSLFYQGKKRKNKYREKKKVVIRGEGDAAIGKQVYNQP